MYPTESRPVNWEDLWKNGLRGDSPDFLTLLNSSDMISFFLPILFCIDGFFPVRYSRDYTHGLITTAIHVLPVLRTDTEDAAIASNCVLNTGVFRGDDEFIHT